jgi:amidohydrolase
MALKETVQSIASDIREEIIGVRRHLHQYPELSFHEVQTSAYIKRKLDEMGIMWQPVAGTGVLATINGALGAGKVIALRADMDALAIEDKKETEYRSKNKGVMHACGHDAHTAVLLGVARILKAMEYRFNGTVKLIFQPAEEILPGGAARVIGEGALTDPGVDLIIGQHVMPALSAGKVGIRRGKFMASMDEISIIIKGKGGHGAQPHLIIDPVLAASSVIVILQQLISRKNNPAIPSVLSFGKFQANGTINIIPDEVLLEGTFRTMDEKWRQKALQEICQLTKSVTEGLGCTCEINIRNGYPSLYNPASIVETIERFMEEYLGKQQVEECDIWMASEDFSYYSEVVDSFFYLLGVGEEGRESLSLHTSTFDINENAMETGMGLMAYIVLKYLDV